MATSRIRVTEGSGKNAATHSFTEDAETKELQRIVPNTPAGVDQAFGAGNVDTGTSRFTLATDDAAIAALIEAIDAAEIETGIVATNIGARTGDITDLEWSETTLNLNQLVRIVARENSEINVRDQAFADSTDPANVAIPGTVLDVTLSLDTAIYASGDVLATTQEITSAFSHNGGRAMLDSLVVLDEDDLGTAFDIVLFDANSTLGTENVAPSITDAAARTIIGIGGPSTSPTNPLRILAADYLDLGGSKIQSKSGIGLHLKAGAATTSLWIGAILTAGTPTHTASGIRLKLGLSWLD